MKNKPLKVVALMALDATSEQKVRGWVNQFNPTCPGCGANNWTPLDLIGSPIFQTPLPPQNPGKPVGTAWEVLILCETCACTLHVAAAILGLVPMPANLKP
jgi:hypothetical protein